MTKRIMSNVLSILLISTSASMQAFPTYAKSSAKTTSPVYCTWYKSPSSPNWCWGNYVKVVKMEDKFISIINIHLFPNTLVRTIFGTELIQSKNIKK